MFGRVAKARRTYEGGLEFHRRKWAAALLLRRIAREFRVRQAHAEIGELIGPDCKGRRKIVCAGCGHDVVLVHTVAAYSDGADQLTIAIKRKSARENGDAVRQIRARRRR